MGRWSDAGKQRPDRAPQISQPWPGLSTSRGSGWRAERAEAASEIGNSLGTSACAPAVGLFVGPQLVQGAVPAMPPARCEACFVHLLTLELLSCPVLGLAAAVPCIGRRAQKRIKPAKGEGLGGLGKWMGIEVGEGSSLAQGCPFTEQTSFGLTLEAGSGVGGMGPFIRSGRQTQRDTDDCGHQVAVRFPHDR